MEEESQLRRPQSLEVQWESLMAKSVEESEEAAEDDAPVLAHPPSDALADATRSPRAQSPACAVPS